MERKELGDEKGTIDDDDENDEEDEDDERLIGQMDLHLAIQGCASPRDTAIELIASCVSVFPFVDSIMALFEKYPIIDPPPIPTTIDTTKSKMTMKAWFEEKVKYQIDEEFDTKRMNVHRSLCMPIGSAMRHARVTDHAVQNPARLYSAEFGRSESERFTEMGRGEKSGQRMFTLDWVSSIDGDKPTAKYKAPVTHGEDKRVRYMQDAVVLYTYAWHYKSKLEGCGDWLSAYLVTSDNFRTSLARLDRKLANGKPRLPIIVHIADTFYLHDTANMIRIKGGAFDAVWHWTHILKHERKSVLPSGVDVASRWTNMF